MHVSEDNIYGADNIYVLVDPKDPVINVLKICIFIINISGGEKKKGKKTKPHHVSGGEALKLSMACSSPKNKVRVLKNCIHTSIVLEGILCVIC